MIGNRPTQPGDPARLFQQALALHQTGRFAEAERLYRAVLRQDRDHLEALYNLGLLRLLGSECEEAAKLLRKALYRRPNFAEAHNALAVALRTLGRSDEAIAQFAKALTAKPDFAEAHNNFGATLLPLRRYDEALAHFDRALALKPDFAEAYHGRGTVLRILGRLHEARQALESAVALAPRRAEFYRSLAESKRFAEGDPHRTPIEALACDMAALSEEEQVHLHFALGKIYGDVGEHQRALAHLVAGNALKRKQIVYDEAAALARLDRTRALFSAEVMRERAGQGDPSPIPIFILGMPRSGTTLVEQMLASHPQVHGAGELSDFEAAVAALDGPDGVPPDIGGAELRRIGADYLARVTSAAPAAERITDKMPGNFRFAGLIHLALPNARIIHLCRNPVDTCLSCFSILFGGDQPYTYDLGELGRYHRAYAALMEHWRRLLPPGVMLEVRYEALVADFEPQARRIVAHCGLDWNDACRDFHKTERPVHTASAVQVRQPVYQTSVGRWRPPAAQLRPLLDALNRNQDPSPY
jgi:tetratricopeptide (TPR) repeat protein